MNAPPPHPSTTTTATFDQFSVFSDASAAPRTPSPADLLFANNHIGPPPVTAAPIGLGHKPSLTIDPSATVAVVPPQPRIYGSDILDDPSFPQHPHSLLQQLYDPDAVDLAHYPLPDLSDSQNQYWQPHLHHHHQHPHQQQQQLPHRAHPPPVSAGHVNPHPRPSMRGTEYVQQAHSLRRATFPVVRHDREDAFPPHHHPNPTFLPHPHHHQDHHLSTFRAPTQPNDTFFPDPSQPCHPSSYHHEYRDSQTVIKLEDHPPPLLSQQQQPHPSHPQPTFYHLGPAGGVEGSSSGAPPAPHFHHSSPVIPTAPPHPHPHPHAAHHTRFPIQHTDDAASKETQYLRRRCFNCHTTEPPSWRRSTLNQGKIVCNKCGLYERTHLRARPLRFDELRGGGTKARKGGATGGGSSGSGNGNGCVSMTGKCGVSSPKTKANANTNNAVAAATPMQIKKEPTDDGIVRRSSVSSVSSLHSGGSSSGSGSGSGGSSNGAGMSDWDDSVSVYSNGSAAPPTFGSPSTSDSSIGGSPHLHQHPPQLMAASVAAHAHAHAHENGIRLPNVPLLPFSDHMQGYHHGTSSSSLSSGNVMSGGGVEDLSQQHQQMFGSQLLSMPISVS